MKVAQFPVQLLSNEDVNCNRPLAVSSSCLSFHFSGGAGVGVYEAQENGCAKHAVLRVLRQTPDGRVREAEDAGEAVQPVRVRAAAVRRAHSLNTAGSSTSSATIELVFFSFLCACALWCVSLLQCCTNKSLLVWVSWKVIVKFTGSCPESLSSPSS